ncbi:MAG: alpha/beta hydrolase [Pedobacter sp.]
MKTQAFYSRRRFISAAALAVSSTQLSFVNAINVNASDVVLRPNLNKNKTNSRFQSIKQIKAGVLDVGYAEAGSPQGPPVILLHGWPYDIHSFEEVVPLLTANGFRVLLPFARGFGSTRFLQKETPRNGQQAALAADVIAFMDALQIENAIIAGFDWGARTANIIAAIWPQRCKAMVAVSGYIVVDRVANRKPLPPKAELGWWYQYYFSTDRGITGYRENTNEFNKLIWELASPKWKFDESTFLKSAKAFDNPDHVEIVVHNYRWRLELEPGESQYEKIEEQLSRKPVIEVPSITVGSDFDGAVADGSKYKTRFSGTYKHYVLDGIGHNVPQEAPERFASIILEAAKMSGS